jgi:type I site-specific restriction endonuclease
MPFYCVAANCTNKACLKDGISLHNIPYFNDEHAEAKRRRTGLEDGYNVND